MLKYQIIRGSNIPQLITRNYSYIFSKRFYKVPYDEQYEYRDFIRKVNLTIPDNLSNELKNLLIKKNPKDFGFLGYSNVKYTCKTKEEHEFDNKYPFE